MLMYTLCVYTQKSSSVITHYCHTKKTRGIRMCVGTLAEAGGPTSGRGYREAIIKHVKYLVFCTRACVTPIARPKPCRFSAVTENIRRRRGLYYPAKGFTVVVKDFKAPINTDVKLKCDIII